MTDKDSDLSSGVLISPTQQMLSSCSGAVLTSIFVTPLDVVKVRLQAQQNPTAKCSVFFNGLMDHICELCGKNGHTAYSHGWTNTNPARYSGTLDAFRQIFRSEGIGAFWSGLSPTLVMAVPATVIYFTCYEQLKGVLRYRQSVLGDWWKPMMAGVLARVFAVSVISPLELVRTKHQSEKMTYREIFTALLQRSRQRGVISLWIGLGSTLLRDVPFSAVYWLSYESAKSKVLRTRGSSELRPFESFVSGAGAGSIAAIITNPFDVIKTHRQIQLGEIPSDKKAGISTWRLIIQLCRQNGFSSLFSGIVPRIFKVAPACAIMITSYEYLKTKFYVANQKKSLHIH
ncbi:hypothetical protein LOTGIDRAFT_232578 [Lottia gigantea]|uniref:Solute carrier family 25 member 40 n=1 Tax=Lottia gigantea TaxID=225164 RepID=V4BWS8_LOTGI|nr:hypothetical protein LOTGIDRAFT_232578 [Lottia gigantea]ESO93484.1 hypothetical protein LOTGIDRAFT_232578 [Lottia gigantea]